MTSLIKSDIADQPRIRPLALSVRPAMVAPAFIAPSEIDGLRAEIDRLTSAVANREQDIALFKEELAAQFQAGLDQGREKGRLEAQDLEATRLATLKEASREALSKYNDSLRALERLSGLIAVEGLEQILGPSERYEDLLIPLIRRQMSRIEIQSVVSIEVSPKDFPDAGKLEDLAKAIGHPALDIQTSDSLGSGGCRMRLRLGTLEIGLDQQWDRLRAALLELGRSETPA